MANTRRFILLSLLHFLHYCIFDFNYLKFSQLNKLLNCIHNAIMQNEFRSRFSESAILHFILQYNTACDPYEYRIVQNCKQCKEYINIY